MKEIITVVAVVGGMRISAVWKSTIFIRFPKAEKAFRETFKRFVMIAMFKKARDIYATVRAEAMIRTDSFDKEI